MEWVGDYWASRWFIFILIAFAALLFRSKLRLSLKIFIAFLMLNTIRNFAYPFDLQLFDKMPLYFNTSWTALVLFAFVIFAGKTRIKQKHMLYFEIFYIFWCFFTIFGTNLISETAVNRSVNATTISLMLPLVFSWPNLVLGLIAISFTNATMGLLSCVTSATFYLLLKYKKLKLLLIAPIALFWGWYFCSDNFFSFSGRLPHWQLAYEFYTEKASLLFGFGNGTFKYLFPMIQEMKGLKTHNIFVFLHSDYIQNLFENGIIGSFLGAIVMIDYFIHTLKTNKKMAMFIVALACNMFGNFPLHVAEQTIFICLALSIIHQSGDTRA